MTGRVRNHRRTGLWEAVAAIVAVLAVCAGLTSARGALAALVIRWPVIGVVVLAAGIGYAACLRWWRRRRAARAQREMAGWRASSGWRAVPPRAEWPWTSLQRWPDVVTVLSGYARTIGGFPVTVGEISWTENGLGRTVDRYAGSGAVRAGPVAAAGAVDGGARLPRRSAAPPWGGRVPPAVRDGGLRLLPVRRAGVPGCTRAR
jgi:hypothetical protein